MSFIRNYVTVTAGPGEGMWAAVSYYFEPGDGGTTSTTLGLYATEEEADSALNAYDEKMQEGSANEEKAYGETYLAKKWFPCGRTGVDLELFNVYYTTTTREQGETSRKIRERSFVTLTQERIAQKIAAGDEALALAWANRDKAVLVPEKHENHEPWKKVSFSDVFIEIPENKYQDDETGEWKQSFSYEEFVSFTPKSVVFELGENPR